MPVRNVVLRTKTTTRYIVPSYKNGRDIQCESGLERDLMLLLEFSPQVVRYEEQPQVFRIHAEPKYFNATPDVKVSLDSNESNFLEVKYERKAQKLAEKHQQIAGHLKSMGYRYQVVTEKHIRPSQIVLDNCLILNGYRTQIQRSKDEMSNYVPGGTFTLRELIEKLGDSQLAMTLIAQQLIYHDFTKILSQKSELRASEPGDFDFLLPFLCD
jgi:hypothetical protein